MAERLNYKFCDTCYGSGVVWANMRCKKCYGLHGMKCDECEEKMKEHMWYKCWVCDGTGIISLIIKCTV